MAKLKIAHKPIHVRVEYVQTLDKVQQLGVIEDLMKEEKVPCDLQPAASSLEGDDMLVAMRKMALDVQKLADEQEAPELCFHVATTIIRVYEDDGEFVESAPIVLIMAKSKKTRLLMSAAGMPGSKTGREIRDKLLAEGKKIIDEVRTPPLLDTDKKLLSYSKQVIIIISKAIVDFIKEDGDQIELIADHGPTNPDVPPKGTTFH
jgi:hypothetical protein